MDQITDIHVTIDVEHPAPVIGLGQVAILTPAPDIATETTYKEYGDLDSLVIDYAATTEVYKTAAANLAQSNSSGKIAVMTYIKTSADAAVDKYFGEEWHFALMPEADQADKLAVANKILSNKFKFLVNQTADLTELTVFGTNRRVIHYYHTNANEYLAAAVLGDVANLTVGQATWKFRKNLVGVTPIQISKSELTAIHEAGANAYVLKAGIPSTSEGITASGEYIDNVHGEDWIKANIESGLQFILLENDKVSFDATGFALVNAGLTSVFELATTNGIVEKNADGSGNYTISMPSPASVPAQDRVDRILNNLKPVYKPDGAIHEMTVFITARNE